MGKQDLNAVLAAAIDPKELENIIAAGIKKKIAGEMQFLIEDLVADRIDEEAFKIMDSPKMRKLIETELEKALVKAIPKLVKEMRFYPEF